MEILIRTVTGGLYVYNTTAATPAAIRNELETAASFLVRDFGNRRNILVLRSDVAEFLQYTQAEYLRDTAP